MEFKTHKFKVYFSPTVKYHKNGDMPAFLGIILLKILSDSADCDSCQYFQEVNPQL